ncbi:MAG: sigma-70 family RNA polymerase sigma factor [Bacteroidales bacterium]
MEKKKELHIIKNIRSGQHECYKELVDEYSAPIFSFIKGIAGNYQDAQDIAQEVFVKRFFSLDKYRGESTFFSWIYRIAYNETISFLRKKNKKSSINFIDNIEYSNNNYPDSFLYSLEENGINLKIAEEEQFRKLKESIAKLETEEQFLILQFYYKNSSIKDLENITGLSESNIKTKLFRIKKKLASLMIQNKK